MAVDYQHPQYTDNKDKWDRCEIAASGQAAVHAAGTLLLPKLSEQTSEEYDAYRSRTPFYNATWRTIVGLQGMVFRKPPVVEVPPVVKPMLDNVTLSGENLYIFALGLAEEALKIGRLGVFCDYPVVPEGSTKADALILNHRPMLRMYKAKSIINWKTRTINNATVLSMVVLEESRMDALDEFEDSEKKQYRVLDLIDLEVDRVVKSVFRVRVIEIVENNGKKDEITLSTAYPKIDGEYLYEIPFKFIGVDSTSWEVDEPPLIDLVDVNLSHYRVSADYEHGCHFTGLPTPVISGYETTKNEDGNPSEKFCIGSMTAWVFPRSEAKASYLEFTGQGLGALEKNLERKERLMAVLGARMLEPQTGGKGESTETVAIHHGGEQSMLSSVAQAISIAITDILKVFTRFAGGDDKKVKFELNRDFFPVPMDALKLTALIAGWQNSAYSYDTLFDNLQKAEFIKLDKTPEQELKEIEKNPPALPPGKIATTTGDSVKDGPQSAQTAVGGKNANPSQTQLQNGTGN